jgi:hypothetical protein
LIRPRRVTLAIVATVAGLLAALLPATPAAAATHRSPNPRSSAAMAQDLSGGVLLFGGLGVNPLADTWTVLLGGERTDTENIVADMWSWEGTDWTQQHPAHLPPRRWAAGMAYDGATGQIVLFGGQGGTGQDLGDLWTWDGTDWTGHLAGMIKVIPRSGPPGSAVDVEGWGFARREHVKFWFVDDVNGRTLIGTTKTDRSGGFRRTLIIPGNATPGTQHVKAIGRTSGQIGRAGFDVT